MFLVTKVVAPDPDARVVAVFDAVVAALVGAADPESVPPVMVRDQAGVTPGSYTITVQVVPDPKKSEEK